MSTVTARVSRRCLCCSWRNPDCWSAWCDRCGKVSSHDYTRAETLEFALHECDVGSVRAMTEPQPEQPVPGVPDPDNPEPVDPAQPAPRPDEVDDNR